MQFQALAFSSTKLITCNWGNKAETYSLFVFRQEASRKVGLLAEAAESKAHPRQHHPRSHLELCGCRDGGCESSPITLQGAVPRHVNLELLKPASKVAMQPRRERGWP